MMLSSGTASSLKQTSGGLCMIGYWHAQYSEAAGGRGGNGVRSRH